MDRGLFVHNLTQITIPVWLIPILLDSFPRVDSLLLGFAVVLGTLFPDVDHFSMWRKYKKKGFWGFIKFCIHADRYRKAFLPFHNHFAIYVIAAVAVLAYFVNVFLFAFFVAFFVHLIFDYVADLYLIKQHTHWRLRNWFNENYSGLSAAQQVQQGDKQKDNSGKPGRGRQAKRSAASRNR